MYAVFCSATATTTTPTLVHSTRTLHRHTLSHCTALHCTNPTISDLTLLYLHDTTHTYIHTLQYCAHTPAHAFHCPASSLSAELPFFLPYVTASGSIAHHLIILPPGRLCRRAQLSPWPRPSRTSSRPSQRHRSRRLTQLTYSSTVFPAHCYTALCPRRRHRSCSRLSPAPPASAA